MVCATNTNDQIDLNVSVNERVNERFNERARAHSQAGRVAMSLRLNVDDRFVVLARFLCSNVFISFCLSNKSESRTCIHVLVWK